MPKIVITEDNLPLVLHTLDKWTGKLTWASYTDRLSEILGVESISRQTLLNYPAIKRAFDLKKEQLKNTANQKEIDVNSTLELLKSQKATLEAKVSRLEDELNMYKEQFVRWQYNLYMMPGVNLEKLNNKIDSPLPSLDRASE